MPIVNTTPTKAEAAERTERRAAMAKRNREDVAAAMARHGFAYNGTRLDKEGDQ